MRNLASLFLILIFLSSCKKDKDTVTSANINGQVFNLTTDSGIAGVKVYLNIKKDGALQQSLETTSGTNGNFTFSNVEIHSFDDYSYGLSVPSKSGIGGGGEVGFNGDNITLNKNNLLTQHKLNVVPKFYDLTLSFNKINQTSSTDSLIILLSQNIFHKNVPGLPYIIGDMSYGNVGTYSFSFGNYPMGNWNITIDKWISGIHTTEYDSIYLDWGETDTYTINW